LAISYPYCGWRRSAASDAGAVEGEDVGRSRSRRRVSGPGTDRQPPRSSSRRKTALSEVEDEKRAWAIWSVVRSPWSARPTEEDPVKRGQGSVEAEHRIIGLGLELDPLMWVLTRTWLCYSLWG